MATQPDARASAPAVTPVLQRDDRELVDDDREFVEDDLLVEDISIDGMCGVY